MLGIDVWIATTTTRLVDSVEIALLLLPLYLGVTVVAFRSPRFVRLFLLVGHLTCSSMGGPFRGGIFVIKMLR